MSQIFWFLGIFVFTALFPNTSLAGSDVVATVNGKPITAFELNEEFQDLLPMAGGYHGEVSAEKAAEIRGKAMENLIEKEMQYQYAVEKGIRVSDEEIESEFAAVEKRFGSSRRFKEALKKLGISKSDLRGFIRKRALTAKAKETAVASKAAVSDAEIREYYEKNRATFKRPMEMRASHILIGVDPAAAKEERGKKLDLARNILERVRKGESFEELAMRYSADQRSAPIGGDIGTFHMGMAEESIEKAIVPLEVGEVSDVVETIYGYHIIKLTGRKPETHLSFDEIKDDIKRSLEKKRSEELYKKWMGDLRAKANIEILKK